ncbi:MFS transporter [Bremerella cremea]|uniref:MFS transporter n=1 Tax=Bremerella cremea TaxID=1031537 RepID=A0A368KU33_9BACT|nr:MFS transporter [Bremerella cremea]RCS50583.1 MFS transporter [Bremerella cremea]
MIQPVGEIQATSRGANQNAGIWGIGNGLVSTTLVTYFALSIGAQEVAISWIIAAPKLVGVLRWFAPYLLKLGGSYRMTSATAFLLSTLFLLLLPLCAVPGIWTSTSRAITAIVICWCFYHLAEYCGFVVFIAWLVQLVPNHQRGRFFGLRERWLTAGKLIGSLFAGLLAVTLRDAFVIDFKWISYPFLAVYGALAMGISVLPLSGIPEPKTQNQPHRSFLEDLQHWRNSRAYWFLLYGTWFSSANGLFSTLLYVYPYRGLNISLLVPMLMVAAMQLGQSLLSRPAGAAIDRFGWRRVMICGQLFVALGPLLYSFGTIGYVAGNLVWIAYALINVALPIAVVDGRSDASAGPPLALYFAWTGLVYGLTALAGWSVANYFVAPELQYDPTAYRTYFFVATLLRLSAVIPLLLLPAESRANK